MFVQSVREWLRSKRIDLLLCRCNLSAISDGHGHLFRETRRQRGSTTKTKNKTKTPPCARHDISLSPSVRLSLSLFRVLFTRVVISGVWANAINTRAAAARAKRPVPVEETYETRFFVSPLLLVVTNDENAVRAKTDRDTYNIVSASRAYVILYNTITHTRGGRRRRD